jgi:hypothetical protein
MPITVIQHSCSVGRYGNVRDAYVTVNGVETTQTLQQVLAKYGQATTVTATQTSAGFPDGVLVTVTYLLTSNQSFGS